jgi:hypothetical protein
MLLCYLAQSYTDTDDPVLYPCSLPLQIAATCGATSPTAASHLYKVLRVLAQHDMLDELPGRKFTPNAATVQLVQGEAPSLGHMASHLINPPKWDAWKVLPQVSRLFAHLRT